MKKLLVAVLLLAAVITFGASSNAHAFTLTGIESFGSLVSLPISGPTTIDVMGGVGGTVLKTKGSIDYAVLYNGSVYSYFYQVENLGLSGAGSGDGATLRRTTFDNLFSWPVLGSGVIADGLDSVTLDTTEIDVYAANLALRVGETTDRFYFQFSVPPGITNGYLINGGIGAGNVVGPAPEPASLALLGMGILGLFGLRKKS